MPIIEYKCLNCGKEYEVFYRTQTERTDEESLQPCPSCESVEKEKLISSGTSFILKGRGWERDGYNG